MSLPEQQLCEAVAEAIEDASVLPDGQVVVGRRAVPTPNTVGTSGYVQVRPLPRLPVEDRRGHATFGCVIEVWAPYTATTDPRRLDSPAALWTLMDAVTAAVTPLMAATHAAGAGVDAVWHERTEILPWAHGSLAVNGEIELRADGPDPASPWPC